MMIRGQFGETVITLGVTVGVAAKSIASKNAVHGSKFFAAQNLVSRL